MGDDANLRALLESGATHVTLVGKAWDRQVEEVLEKVASAARTMTIGPAESVENTRAVGGVRNRRSKITRTRGRSR